MSFTLLKYLPTFIRHVLIWKGFLITRILDPKFHCTIATTKEELEVAFAAAE